VKSLDEMAAVYRDEILADYRAGDAFEPDGVLAVMGSGPVGVVGYGSDLHCTDDCDAFMSEVPDGSPEAVGEYHMRNLQTTAGELFTDPEVMQASGEDPHWGSNLFQMLSVGYRPEVLAASQDLAAAAIRRDDRVEMAAVEISHLGGKSYRVRVHIDLRVGGTYTNVFELTAGEFPK